MKKMKFLQILINGDERNAHTFHKKRSFHF